MASKTPSPFLTDSKPDTPPQLSKSTKSASDSFIPTIKKRKRSLSSDQIPVTVLTGYLGAGKTTVITNLIKQMPDNYSVAWLKNEMGGTVVDTALAADSHTATVKEMLQGCICHVMIGQLGDALDELVATNPQRIIIEASGSATPAPVVWQIREHEKLFVDGVVTVVDAENFSGYVDKSPALKMQAKYTDLILINKHESLTVTDLEQNLDDLYEINLSTPKIKTNRGFVDANVVFGLDSQLFLTAQAVEKEEGEADKNHYTAEVELLEMQPGGIYDTQAILKFAESLPGSDFYRIKAVLRDETSDYILNCAFGKAAITRLTSNTQQSRIVFMGENLSDHKDEIKDFFDLKEEEITYTPKDYQEHTVI